MRLDNSLRIYSLVFLPRWWSLGSTCSPRHLYGQPVLLNLPSVVDIRSPSCVYLNISKVPLNSQMPTSVKHILIVIFCDLDTHNIDIKQIGFISSLPHICAIVSYPLCGIIADYLRKNEIFTPTQVSSGDSQEHLKCNYISQNW